METKHTHGPWTVGMQGKWPVIFNSNRSMLAQAGGIDDSVHGPCVETSKANAKLIAAAPELLAALQSALRFCEQCPELDSLTYTQCIEIAKMDTKARAAIAKATE